MHKLNKLSKKMSQFQHCLIGCLWFWFMTSAHLAKADVFQPSMVIIIDDLGYNLANGLGIINLPGPITLAVIPHTRHGASLASTGAKVDKEIMLHVPMQNHAGIKLGKGGLTLGMDEKTFKDILRKDAANIPFTQGLNNHMGSALTEQALPMLWTMDVAKELELFFVDSRTSATSVAWQQAIAQNVPTLKRDVFLDNDTSTEALEIQFHQAMDVARKNKFAVLIGHPYPETIAFLSQSLGKLDEAGIKLVSASALIELLKPHLDTL